MSGRRGRVGEERGGVRRVELIANGLGFGPRAQIRPALCTSVGRIWNCGIGLIPRFSDSTPDSGPIQQLAI
ncbi:hypothetical protein CRG98_042270 [Punica granatum]|uniref:Uncharacterized protein n=1 Tax=Punica granatum TaxID=22663 RepID=A0A2I0I0R1_PUNGR|nr:hypothetical protein CRG98_042270 [Punica granatum]